jgi:hypothetical protein
MAKFRERSQSPLRSDAKGRTEHVTQAPKGQAEFKKAKLKKKASK